MAGDVQLTALAVHAAPLDYIVPANAVIRVKSVKAEFRDNSAGGDWLPAVEFISDAKISGPTASDQGAKVTAGGDADASFFPGVKPAAATTTGKAFHWCTVTLGDSTPSGTIDVGPGTLMPIIAFATDDPANYSQIDANTWDVAHVPQIIVCQLVPGPGGAATVTNGDVGARLGSGAGGATLAFAANAIKVWNTTGAQVATTTFQYSSPFSGRMRGNDTHTWFINAYFGATY